MKLRRKVIKKIDYRNNNAWVKKNFLDSLSLSNILLTLAFKMIFLTPVSAFEGYFIIIISKKSLLLMS